MVITDAELESLHHKTVAQLQVIYHAVWGESTDARNKGWLVKRIAWRMQANAEGGLSDRFRERVAELADAAHLRVTAPRPKSEPTTAPLPPVPANDHRLPLPGAILKRVYKGRTLHVKVLASGFEYDGTVYASLSAVAQAITGAKWNGYLFFHLKGGK